MNSLRESYKNLIRGQIEDQQAKSGAMEDLAVEEYFKKNPMGSKGAAIRMYRENLNKPINGPGSDEHRRKTGIAMGKYLAGKAPGAN